MMIGADLDEHVGDGNRSDEKVMKRYEIKIKRKESKMIIVFAKIMKVVMLNTSSMKKQKYKVTYKSGGMNW